MSREVQYRQDLERKTANLANLGITDPVIATQLASNSLQGTYLETVVADLVQSVQDIRALGVQHNATFGEIMDKLKSLEQQQGAREGPEGEESEVRKLLRR